MTVIGCGHLGATHAASMAEIGHEVVGVDIDNNKIATLRSGRAWFYEPELDEMLARHVASGRLRFTTDFAEAGEFGEMHFLGVATPGMADRDDYDLSQVWAAVSALAPYLHRSCLIVGKSTVSVGTTTATRELVQELAPAGAAVDVAWNPEFLREGHAVQDTLRPDRIVVGVTSAEAEQKIREAYQPITDAGVPLIFTDPATCELVKGAANAFLATKISFINAMADLCEVAGADVAQLAEAVGLDPRIGRAFLDAGIGYGGGCLPKDTRAFTARAEQLGADSAVGLLTVVDQINASRRRRVVDATRKVCGGDLTGKRITLWGAAFKVGTDDVRDSPALDVAIRMHAQGAEITVYDPMALETARAAHPELGYVGDALTAAAGADVLVVVTAWPEFRTIDPEAIAEVVAERVVIDACNALDEPRWNDAYWSLHRIGRG
ncbi:UDP-glucose dehydrogenase family protein [Streptosporangium sp. NBC_01756]|uniref:UDP-glucose dehydrogenase family protein n=1 Tax=Streptosporangium sp. NBC_01756 TaxID=2975950 RepID=UPI002DDA8438|nr:UDP-glucose/GDP-mannose dehydrogenase family protein [Streptosporangium sp. NBC_01756]WSC90661.1 UDP-glucose/GDP-mannose dehydrogenase family protein [Streptosporangium sp. NBC_01756]